MSAVLPVLFRPLPHWLLAGILLTAAPSSADEIALASPDYWCPFSCKADSVQEGFAVEIIRSIFTAAGHRVHLINENYSRALVNVRAGIHTATPSTFKEEAPDFVFPELPISRNRYCFFTRTSDRWTYSGPNSLDGRRTGIIRDYAYGRELDLLIQATPALFDVHTGDNLTERLVKRLNAGRLDAFIEEENLVLYTVRRDSRLQVRTAGCLTPRFAYMAISPKHPNGRRYAELFTEGMRRLHQSGELKRILAGYGLEVWPLPSP